MNLGSIASGVQEHVKVVKEVSGTPNVLSAGDPDPAAAEAATNVDQVILALGSDLSFAREGHDAIGIEMSVGQWKLFRAVVAVAKKPVIVVVLTATPLDITEIMEHPNV